MSSIETTLQHPANALRACRAPRIAKGLASALRWEKAWWAALAPLILAALLGLPWALLAALAVGAMQLAHFVFAAGSWRPVAVQARVLFLALLAAGGWPAFWAVHALMLASLFAMLAVDYCLLTRLLWLAPWNRRVPLSRDLLDWALFAPPAPDRTLARQARAYGRRCKPSQRPVAATRPRISAP